MIGAAGALARAGWLDVAAARAAGLAAARFGLRLGA
jgi:hypothetical protein